MRHFAISLLTLIMSATLYALPMGNPAEASLLTQGVCCDACSIWSLRGGFYGSYVYNHHLEVDENGFRPSVERAELYTNAGYLALNLCNRWDLFGTLGTTHIKIKGRGTVFILPAPSLVQDDDITIDSETAFSWSIGLRGTLLEWNCWKFGGEFQYFSTSPKVNVVGSPGLPLHPSGVHVDYYEWQIGVGLSYLIALPYDCTTLLPYVGIRRGHTGVDMDNAVIFDPLFPPSGGNIQLRDLQNERGWGYAIGATLVEGAVWSFTAEGRFGDERALYINSQLRF